MAPSISYLVTGNQDSSHSSAPLSSSSANPRPRSSSSISQPKPKFSHLLNSKLKWPAVTSLGAPGVGQSSPESSDIKLPDYNAKTDVTVTNPVLTTTTVNDTTTATASSSSNNTHSVKKDALVSTGNEDHHGDLENRAVSSTFALATPNTPSHLSSSTSLPSTILLDNSNDEINNADEENEISFPEGGFEAWRVVLGSFCGLLPVFGLVNSLGALQAYIRDNQLAQKSESQVAWVVSVFLFIDFFLTGQVGYLFDCYGPYYLTVAGICFFTLGLFATSFCTEYYQFFLAFSICCGTGAALLMTPGVSIISHWFNQRRGAAIGVATMGGSFGGVIFPILLRNLYSSVGFAWAIRILAFICFGLLVCSLLLIKPRLESDKKFKLSVNTIFDAPSLKDSRFTWLCVANFLGELGVINGLTFLTSYALAAGKSESMSYALLAMLNGTGMIGRVVPGFVADKLGRFNTLIFITVVGAITIFTIWLPFGKYTAGLITFALAHGFCNGGIYSLVPACCGQICRTRDYGKRFGTMFFLTSFTVLLGVPLSGLLIGDGGSYDKLVIFNGSVYCGTAIALIASRYYAVGLKWKKW